MRGTIIGFGWAGAGRNRKPLERCADLVEVEGVRRETFAVDLKATVTIDGEVATLAHLRIGDKIETSGQPVTSIEVLR